MPQQEKLAKLARMAKLRNLMTFSVGLGRRCRQAGTAPHCACPEGMLWVQDVPEGTLDAPAAILAMVKGVVTELAASQPVRKKRSTSMAKVYRRQARRQDCCAAKQTIPGRA